MSAQFIVSQKGKSLLVCKGFLFKKDKDSAGSTYWQCVDSTVYKCKSRCVTSGNKIIRESGNHNHVQNHGAIEAKDRINKMKYRATTSNYTAGDIIAECSSEMSISGVTSLPVISNLKKTIYRARAEEKSHLGTSASALELIIPDTYKNMNDEVFLQHDSTVGENRILIFATASGLEFLKGSKHWFADGTFKTVPPLFHQLYTIHGMRSNTVIPAVFALLPNRTQQTYTRLLCALRELIPSLNPDSLMSDFELAFLNAFKTIFQVAKQRGCLFHFAQCNWRKIRTFPDLYEKCISETDPDFSIMVRKLLALAYIRPADVIKSFQLLVGTDFFKENMEILQGFLDYYESNLIGRPHFSGVGRRNPSGVGVEIATTLL